MARLDDGLFEYQLARPKGVLRFRTGGAQRGDEMFRSFYVPHAPATAARCRLDHHRIADARSLLQHARVGYVLAFVTRHARYAGGVHHALGSGLVAHRANGPRGGADEDKPCVDARDRKRVALRKEAIPGVDGFCAGSPRRIQQRLDVQIRRLRLRWTDRQRKVRRTAMRRIAVSLGIDGDRAHAQPSGGALDAHGDFAAIGDQYRAESMRRRHDQSFRPGKVFMYLQMMPSMTSSAPPPMEARRPSR